MRDIHGEIFCIRNDEGWKGLKGDVSLRRSSMRMIHRKAERTDPCGQQVEMLIEI